MSDTTLIESQVNYLHDRIAALERDLAQERKWHHELLDAIYEEMPDGMNERPDPRVLVREWRKADGQLAIAKEALQQIQDCPPPANPLGSITRRLQDMATHALVRLFAMRKETER